MIWTIAAFVIIGYVILYLWGRRYLENFAPRFAADGTPERSAKALQQPMLAPGEREVPVLQDGLEASTVFQQEGSREASQKQLNDAMTRYPLDWSTQGPNSQLFQEKQAQQKSQPSLAPFPSADVPSPFGPDSPPQYSGTSIDLPTLHPQQVRTQDDEDILKTYEPKSSKGLLEYAVEDVKHLIERVYDKRGEVAEVVKSKQGSNVWEIIEVREKNPVIEWEPSTQQVAQQMRGENRIEVPHTASDALNPFLAPRESVRKGKNDLSPQLQRMYEPTYPVPAWN